MDTDISFQHEAVMQTLAIEIAKLEQQKEDLTSLTMQISAQHSLTHIGSNCFLNTTRDRSQPVLVNLGCGIYVEMTDSQIAKFAENRHLEVEVELSHAKRDLAEIQLLVGILEAE
ncbi:Prefoldin subunit-containing protein [Spironucleus salmonicida]|uniref:Prefoldin subunit-containing protein n=1 Tax=Spironucleus salmonicida TaxID=348837 RepID=V6LDZ9_9EUKA|nr:Prefoldin subunit-containing protein [Spironucleus salmonicida]|eukprot:EST42508.1 Prefoldin subunit-containing protein [Spironucleus salmonicida]